MSDGTLTLNPTLNEQEYTAASQACTDLYGRVSEYERLVRSKTAPISVWSREEIKELQNALILSTSVMRLVQWFLAQLHPTTGRDATDTLIPSESEVVDKIVAPPRAVNAPESMPQAFQQMVAEYRAIRTKVLQMAKITQH